MKLIVLLFLSVPAFAYQVEMSFTGGFLKCINCSDPGKPFIVTLRGDNKTYQVGRYTFPDLNERQNVRAQLIVTRELVGQKYVHTVEMAISHNSVSRKFLALNEIEGFYNQLIHIEGQQPYAVFATFTNHKITSTDELPASSSVNCVVPPTETMAAVQGPGKCEVTYCWDTSKVRTQLLASSFAIIQGGMGSYYSEPQFFTPELAGDSWTSTSSIYKRYAKQKGYSVVKAVRNYGSDSIVRIYILDPVNPLWADSQYIAAKINASEACN